MDGQAGTGWRGAISGFLLLCVVALFASAVSFSQLGGYDLSPLIDLFWRFRQGQAPGLDYIVTWPLQLLLVAKAVGWMGIGWYELTLASILASLAAFAAIMAIGPAQWRTSGWALSVATIIAIPLAYTNHVWHSTLAQLSAMVFATALHRALVGRDATGRGLVVLAASAALAATAKQNMALPLVVVGLGLVLLAGGERRWRLACALAGGAFAGIALSLLVLGMSLGDFIASYTAVSGRALPSAQMFDDLRDGVSDQRAIPGVAIALLLLGWSLFRSWRGGDKTAHLLVVSLLAVAAIPLATDWDRKINDIAFPLFVAVLGIRSTTRTRKLPPFLGAAIGSVLVVAIVGGSTRERMAGVGAFYDAGASRRIGQGYFAGLLTGDRLAGILGGMAAIKESDPGARLFFGPRIEFGYAVTGTPSPVGMPLWWHPGSSYGLADEARVLRAFDKARFDTLVFASGDRTRMPAPLLARIARDYRQRPPVRELDVYDRIAR